MAFIAAWQVPHYPTIADIIWMIQRPRNWERCIGGYLQEEKGNHIFDENKVKGEAESQKLKLLWVVCKRDILFVYDIEAALAEMMVRTININIYACWAG